MSGPIAKRRDFISLTASSDDAPVPSGASLDNESVGLNATGDIHGKERYGSDLKEHLSDSEWLMAARRQQKLKDLFLFAVDTCLRAGAGQWWRRAFRYGAFPNLQQGIAALKDFCLHHLLYELGDVHAFCRAYEILEQEGHLFDDRLGVFLLELSRYINGMPRDAGNALVSEINDDGHAPRGPKRYFDRLVETMDQSLARLRKRRSAIVSMIFPDEATIDNFVEFGGPSLRGERGLQVLSRTRAVTLVVAAKPKRLMDIKRHLEANNPDCQIVCQVIPPNLSNPTENAAGAQRDWLVGGLQGLHLMEAKRQGADFLSVNPNAIYSDGFFEGILSIADSEKPAVSVLLATIRASKGAVRPDLIQFRTLRPIDSLGVDTSLAIPAGDLVNIGLGATGPLRGAKFVDDLRQFRGATSHLQLTCQEEDCVRIFSTRYEIAFLAREMIKKMPPRFFAMPCTELDNILGADAQPHFVEKSDGLAMLELAGENSTSAGNAMDYVDFGLSVGDLTRERQRQFFKRPISLPLSRPVLPGGPDQTPAVDDTNASMVFRAIDEMRKSPMPGPSQALVALNVLHQYEASEYGAENLAGTISEARRILDIVQTDGAAIDNAALQDLIRAAMNFDHVDKAIELAKNGGIGTAFIGQFLTEMMKLRATNAANAKALRAKFPKRPFAVIGSVVWGKPYLAKFLNYCLPSLLSAGNIPALSGKGKVVHSIVTTHSDRRRIIEHPTFARLSEFAEIVFTCFPEDFLEARERSGYNFYYFYGLLDHQNIFLASALQADLYLLPIDCVYSSETLKNFSAYLEKGADCCSIAGVEADETQLREWLDAKGGGTPPVLDLASEELLQAVSERPDAYFRSLVMSPANRSFCKHPRELIWPLSDGLVIHSIFLHPLASSARMLSRPFHPQHENVDFAFLPRLLQGDGKLQIIEDAREAAIAHFGAPQIRDDYLEGGFSIRSFIEAHEHDYAMHRRSFATGQFFSGRDLPYSPSANYATELALIQSALARYRF
jgi:hypothetical protein